MLALETVFNLFIDCVTCYCFLFDSSCFKTECLKKKPIQAHKDLLSTLLDSNNWLSMAGVLFIPFLSTNDWKFISFCFCLGFLYQPTKIIYKMKVAILSRPETTKH